MYMIIIYNILMWSIISLNSVVFHCLSVFLAYSFLLNAIHISDARVTMSLRVCLACCLMQEIRDKEELKFFWWGRGAPIMMDLLESLHCVDCVTLTPKVAFERPCIESTISHPFCVSAFLHIVSLLQHSVKHSHVILCHLRNVLVHVVQSPQLS